MWGIAERLTNELHSLRRKANKKEHIEAKTSGWVEEKTFFFIVYLICYLCIARCTNICLINRQIQVVGRGISNLWFRLLWQLSKPNPLQSIVNSWPFSRLFFFTLFHIVESPNSYLTIIDQFSAHIHICASSSMFNISKSSIDVSFMNISLTARIYKRSSDLKILHTKENQHTS